MQIGHEEHKRCSPLGSLLCNLLIGSSYGGRCKHHRTGKDHKLHWARGPLGLPPFVSNIIRAGGDRDRGKAYGRFWMVYLYILGYGLVGRQSGVYWSKNNGQIHARYSIDVRHMSEEKKEAVCIHRIFYKMVWIYGGDVTISTQGDRGVATHDQHQTASGPWWKNKNIFGSKILQWFSPAPITKKASKAPNGVSQPARQKKYIILQTKKNLRIPAFS